MTILQPASVEEDDRSPILTEIKSLISDLLETSPPSLSDPILHILNPDEIATIQNMALPDEGFTQHSSTPGESNLIQAVLREALTIFENRMRLDHPLCFGYIPSCPSPIAVLGDVLTTISNANAALWNLSSGPSVVEHALIRWLAMKVGMPSSAGGCFVSGGSMANLTAVVAARDTLLPEDGRSKGVVYLSDQTHISIAKGLHMAGFTKSQIRIIPTDSDFRMNVKVLSELILIDRENGLLPFLIVASCGTTNTGSIDPLHTLADIALDEHMWLHVDGAYGASIALSATHSHLVNGLGRADSISWDAHKWLFQTYGCGIVLVKNTECLLNSFAVDAEYISTSSPEGTIDFYNLSPELSRPARAMSLWFTLRVLGQRRIGEMIDHGFLLAQTAEDEIRQHADWQIISPATASIVVFRYAPPGLGEEGLDAINSRISTILLAENVAAILTTKISGRTVLRLCAMNPATKPEIIGQVVRQMNAVAKLEYGKQAVRLAT